MASPTDPRGARTAVAVLPGARRTRPGGERSRTVRTTTHRTTPHREGAPA